MKPLNVSRVTKSGISRLRTLIAANQDSHEVAFLPAALEVVERPPSPLGRGIMLVICAFFVMALVWSYVGKVNEVATAEGRIIPSGQVKVIQPLEIGVVSKIDVTEGQHVKKGQVLVEIDPTGSRAEVARLQDDLQENRLDAALNMAMAKATGPGPAADKAFLKNVPAGVSQTIVDRQLSLLQSSLTEQQSSVAAIDSDIAKTEAKTAQIEADITKFRESLPLIQKRARLRDKLVAQGYSSVIADSKEDQALVEGRQELAEDIHRLAENKAALEQLKEQRQETVSKFITTALTKSVEASRKAESTQQQLIKEQDLESRRTLTAPVAGVVQQLAVHTIGGVVTPAQDLMVIVPNDAKLEVEAMVQNKDIGFVRVGQRVAIKVDTFPFTRYGLRHGVVLDVSRDATTSPPRQNPHAKNADAAPEMQAPAANPLYTAHISLDKDVMPVDGRLIPLTPGMAVTAEIKTDRQRVIDYLLDPLRRYRHDSFQER